VLTDAPWPGNIRELSNTIERLVVFGQTPVVTRAELAMLELTATPAHEEPLGQAQSELWSLEQLNHRYVDWVLSHVEQDKVKAAQILGINLSTLYRWLRRRSH
jgi:two-component system response regulator HydG